MSQPTSPKSTPKRKRDDLIVEQTLSTSPPSKANASLAFSFEPPKTSLDDDGSSSPRTKVAHRLRNLSLESGGGVDSPEHPSPDCNYSTSHINGKAGDDLRLQHPLETEVFNFNGTTDNGTDMAALQTDDDDDSAMRKRHKLQELVDHAPLILTGEIAAQAGPVQVDEHGRLTLEDAVDPAMVKLPEHEGAVAGFLKKSYPSINRLADSKSRSRRRTGTPPLGGPRRKSADTIEEEPVIVDPVRAALTWHEDEITVYDADDKDDDGTGLNGIGFKPTPAIAYQRAQKRKKQLSEYRKREEREARALRNQRRREALGERTDLIRKHSLVRVHFSDVEPETVVTT